MDPVGDLCILENNKQVVQILLDTMDLYGKYEAWILVQKTHSECPWIETARNDEITDEKMREFFEEQLV